MEVQHSKLILFLSWVYTCPFSPSISAFPKRVSVLTAHHPTSYRLFLTCIIRDEEEAELRKYWEREKQTGREVGPVVTFIHLFSFRKEMGLACKNGWLWLIQLGWNLFEHCWFWQRHREKYSVGKNKHWNEKTIFLSARFQGFIPGL